jgi:hypothetical protein
MPLNLKGSFFFSGWATILLAYVISGLLGFGIGSLLMGLVSVEPETVFSVSTKRLSYAFPLITHGQRYGIDQGVLIFIWNALGAATTISFVYTASWFNPALKDRFPRTIRKFFCLPKPMLFLCYLPGCRRFEEESLRRVFVWLMVPLLGMILLGLETGLSLSVGKGLFGSYFIALMALMPHGVVEIPVFAMAGAVAFSAHLMIKQCVGAVTGDAVFDGLDRYRSNLPIKKVAFFVILGLLVAGLVEAHITQPLVLRLLDPA